MVEDDFSGTLSKWTTVLGGGFTIENGELSNSSSGENLMVNSSTGTLNDGVFSVDVKNMTSSTADPSIIVRYQDVNNYYLIHPTGSSMLIYERLVGAYSLKSSGSIPSIVPGQVYRLVVMTEQGTITVFWDGQCVASWTDTSPWLSGKVGFRQTASRYVHWDNVIVNWDSAGSITAYNDYDPWGLVLEGRSAVVAQTDERYKFTSKERDPQTGLDYFGARYYDARIGRWMSVDPLAEKYQSYSPFAYVANNPIHLYDPNGKEITNSKGYVVQNERLVKALVKFNNSLAKLSGKSTYEFVMDVSGGDRYQAANPLRSDWGNLVSFHFSKTNNRWIWNSYINSRHLENKSALGIDLLLPKDITDDREKLIALLRQAAKEANLAINTNYSDGHFHLEFGPLLDSEGHQIEEPLIIGQQPTFDETRRLQPENLRNQVIAKPDHTRTDGYLDKLISKWRDLGISVKVWEEY